MMQGFVIFQMYRATVIWDGKFKVVDVAASESEPLLGMSHFWV